MLHILLESYFWIIPSFSLVMSFTKSSHCIKLSQRRSTQLKYNNTHNIYVVYNTGLCKQKELYDNYILRQLQVSYMQLYDITLITLLLEEEDRLRDQKIISMNQKLFSALLYRKPFSILLCDTKNLDCGVGGTLRRYILSVF